MKLEVLAGFLIAWVVIDVAMAAYSLASWLLRGREREPLLFFFLSLAIAVYGGGAAVLLGAGDPASFEGALRVTLAAQAVAVALLVELALHHTRTKRPAAAAYVSPALAIVFGVFALTGAIYTAPPEGGMAALVPASSLSIPFAVATTAGVVGAAALLFRAFLRDRDEGFPSLLGVLLLTVAMGHDALAAFGSPGPLLLGPFGFAAFLLGVQSTSLWRFASLQTALVSQTRELRRRTKELAKVNEDLRSAQNALVRKEQLAAVGELSAVVAHEIRNPLAIINNAVDSLRKEGLGEDDRKELLLMLDEESSRMDRLVGDLLVYARPVTPQKQLVSPREMVTGALRLVSGRAGIDVDLVEPGEVPKIWADAHLIREVLDNLVRNAIEAMPAGGVLRVTLGPSGAPKNPGVTIEIQDTGEGMDTTVRSRAFDPFFTTRKSGTGLGLAIVARFIEAHGGQLTMKSAAGAGTMMHVFLPVGQKSGDQPERSSDAPPRDTPVPPMPAPLREALEPGGEPQE